LDDLCVHERARCPSFRRLLAHRMQHAPWL